MSWRQGSHNVESIELLMILANSQLIKLHHYLSPKSDLFMSRTDEPRALMSSPALIRQPLPPHLTHLTPPGNATPMPDSWLSSSPAWDPSSRTPQANPDYSFAVPRSSSHLVDPENSLLDARLVNVGLKVVAGEGEYKGKELTVVITSMEGRLSFRRHKYKTSEFLSPASVTPKNPNPRRDNCLLVVIKGEHFGKYARRIYHRFVGDAVICILAVVNRVVGQVPDTLTGDRLEMDASHLCVCEESIEDRKRNDLLMQPLREEARKKRAK